MEYEVSLSNNIFLKKSFMLKIISIHFPLTLMPLLNNYEDPIMYL